MILFFISCVQIQIRFSHWILLLLLKSSCGIIWNALPYCRTSLQSVPWSETESENQKCSHWTWRSTSPLASHNKKSQTKHSASNCTLERYKHSRSQKRLKSFFTHSAGALYGPNTYPSLKTLLGLCVNVSLQNASYSHLRRLSTSLIEMSLLYKTFNVLSSHKVKRTLITSITHYIPDMFLDHFCISILVLFLSQMLTALT